MPLNWNAGDEDYNKIHRLEEKLRKLREFIESEEFFELMYSYRHAPFVSQAMVVETFEAVKSSLKERL